MPSDFKKLMTARFLFTLAVQIQTIVLGWRMYILTKDPLFCASCFYDLLLKHHQTVWQTVDLR